MWTRYYLVHEYSRLCMFFSFVIFFSTFNLQSAYYWCCLARARLYSSAYADPCIPINYEQGFFIFLILKARFNISFFCRSKLPVCGSLLFVYFTITVSSNFNQGPNLVFILMNRFSCELNNKWVFLPGCFLEFKTERIKASSRTVKSTDKKGWWPSVCRTRQGSKMKYITLLIVDSLWIIGLIWTVKSVYFLQFYERINWMIFSRT